MFNSCQARSYRLKQIKPVQKLGLWQLQLKRLFFALQDEPEGIGLLASRRNSSFKSIAENIVGDADVVDRKVRVKTIGLSDEQYFVGSCGQTRGRDVEVPPRTKGGWIERSLLQHCVPVVQNLHHKRIGAYRIPESLSGPAAVVVNVCCKPGTAPNAPSNQ
jgi:hypothetical protein